MRSAVDQFRQSLRLRGFHAQRASFYRDLAKSIEKGEAHRTFFEADLAITRANVTRNAARALAVRLMLRYLQAGKDAPLSKVLAVAMPASDRVLLSALDSSSDHPTTLRRLADAIEDQRQARAALLQPLVTPAIVAPSVGYMVYVISSELVPTIAAFTPPEMWEGFNGLVRTASDILREFFIPFALLTLVLAIMYTYALPRWYGEWRGRLERLNPNYTVFAVPVMPWLYPLALYRLFQSDLLITSLAVQLEAGKSLKEALDLTAKNATPWMRHHLRRVLRHLNDRPNEKVQAFSRGLFSPQLLARIATTLRTSASFEHVLIDLNRERNAEVRQLVNSSAVKLRFVFIFCCAALLLFFWVGKVSIMADMERTTNPTAQKIQQMEKAQGLR